MIRRPNKTDIKSNINRTVLSINLFFCTNSAFFVILYSFLGINRRKDRAVNEIRAQLLQTSSKSFHYFFHFALQNAFRHAVYVR